MISTDLKLFFQKYIITIGIIFVLLLATILRFKGLTLQSYWTDELFSAETSSPSNSFSYMYKTTVADVHPPLYQTILWIWYHLFGFNEYAGRALSAIIGTLDVLAIYLLGKEFFNKEVGLYAAIIASMNYFLIYYSQEVRPYSLLLFLSTMSYLYLMKILTNYSKKNFILYLLFTIALIYTHYFGLFLVATQVFVFIYYFIKDKKQRKHLAILALITAATIIVSLLPLIEHILSNAGKKSFWIKRPTEWFYIDYLKAYTKSLYLDGIFALFSFMSLVYLFGRKKQNPYKNATIALIIWITIGYLLPYLRSITATPLLTPRNTIIVMPALILLISYGIYLLKDILLKTSALTVIVFFSWYQLKITDYYHKITKQQWREVLLEVSKYKNKIPSYDIVFAGLGYNAYSSMLKLNLDISPGRVLDNRYKESSLPKCFWVLDSHGNHTAKHKALQDKAIKKVLEIDKSGARGILFSYKISPDKCLELYNNAL